MRLIIRLLSRWWGRRETDGDLTWQPPWNRNKKGPYYYRRSGRGDT